MQCIKILKYFHEIFFKHLGKKALLDPALLFAILEYFDSYCYTPKIWLPEFARKNFTGILRSQLFLNFLTYIPAYSRS